MNLKAECRKLGRMFKLTSTTSSPLQPWPKLTDRRNRRGRLMDWPRQSWGPSCNCTSVCPRHCQTAFLFYVIGDYLSRYDTGAAVMSRKALLGKRVPLKNTVTVKSIWKMIEGAAKSGTSLRQALILKNQDERSDLRGSSVIRFRVDCFSLLFI